MSGVCPPDFQAGNLAQESNKEKKKRLDGKHFRENSDEQERWRLSITTPSLNHLKSEPQKVTEEEFKEKVLRIFDQNDVEWQNLPKEEESMPRTVVFTGSKRELEEIKGRLVRLHAQELEPIR